MTRVYPQDLGQLLRTYRLAGGRVRRVRVRYGPKGAVAVEWRLTVSKGADRVRLALRLAGVAEFRLQMRPNQPRTRIADARVAYLDGRFFVALDDLGLEPGERPAVHDFRATEAYAAGAELYVAEVAGGNEDARPG